MPFVDGKIVGRAVDLTRAREYDFDRRIVLPARLEDGQLSTCVDIEIDERLLHGIHVAGLADQVEQVIAALFLHFRGWLQGQPNALLQIGAQLLRKMKVLRHHSDDGVRLATDPH